MKEPGSGKLRMSAEELVQQLAAQPHLRERLEAILGIINQEGGQYEKADAAEFALIEEIRKLGQQTLTEWANQGQIKAVKEARAENPKLKTHSKKN